MEVLPILGKNSPVKIMKTKKEIRKQVLELRGGLSEQERRMASLKVADRIIGHQWFYQAERLLIFVSYGSEIDTSEIISEALRKGKKVYVPKVEGDVMEFYRITSLDELVEGYKGIREPSGSSEKYEEKKRLEAGERVLMIMPGASFDPLRNRIGYGKGFYDKYLSDKEQLQNYSIGIGFACQMVEEIPAEENDIKPYQVITG